MSAVHRLFYRLRAMATAVERFSVVAGARVRDVFYKSHSYTIVRYTLVCPTPQCGGCIEDVHHFRLLGQRAYEELHHKAAEATLRAGAAGVYCPNVSRGILFQLRSQELIQIPCSRPAERHISLNPSHFSTKPITCSCATCVARLFVAIASRQATSVVATRCSNHC